MSTTDWSRNKRGQVGYEHTQNPRHRLNCSDCPRCGTARHSCRLREGHHDQDGGARPSAVMQELAEERYKAPSGNDVTLEIDFIPWPLYYERLAAPLTSGEQKYQMVVSDSQWLGAFVEGGYYMKINRFIDSDPELQAIFDDLHPKLVAAYSSYPYRSKDYYGFPQNPEFLIVFYRKDLFCDDGERAAFAAKYRYTLPCTPEQMNDVDWEMVRDFDEFFRRPRGGQLAGQTLDDDFYGSAYQAAKNYDGAIMQINAFIWQNGASIWDESKAPKGQAEGVVNSAAAVAALEHYLSLLKYMPPVAKTGTMDPMKYTSCSTRVRSLGSSSTSLWPKPQLTRGPLTRISHGRGCIGPENLG